jgi:hypothetical protein
MKTTMYAYKLYSNFARACSLGERNNSWSADGLWQLAVEFGDGRTLQFERWRSLSCPKSWAQLGRKTQGEKA